MVIWLAIGGALFGAVARWRLAEARSERAFAAAEAERRERRRGRTRARITRLERTSATLLGMPAVRIELELDLPTRTAALAFTRALSPPQLAWIKVGGLLDLTYDPDDLTNYATELEGRFPDEIGRRVRRSHHPHARVVLAAPLWAIGHDGAEAWLLPPAGPAQLVTASCGGDGDPPALATAALRVADELAFTTSLGAGVTVSLGLDAATGALAADPDAPARPGALVAWGHAAHGDELTLRVRGAEPALRPVTAALAALPAALAGALVAAGRATAVEPPAWYQPPVGDAAAAAYAEILVGLARQVVAAHQHAELAAAAHGEITSRALAHAHAHDDGFVHLAALACVFHAARAGAMTLEQRVYASELIGQYAGTGHPIDLLAPSFLVAFQLRAEARAQLRALRGERGAYRGLATAYEAWLARRFA